MADTKFGNISVYEDDDGKAVWEFEGKVQSDIPLDTEAQNFAEAINELKKLSAERGGDGILRAIIDDDTSSLIIAAGDGADDESHGVYNYTYETLEISDSITMQTTSGSTTATKTKTFSAKLISKLYNADGTLIFRAECRSNGKITGFFDKDNAEIYTEKFELNLGEGVGISGADAPAIAWCMAKNSERSDALTAQREAYKDGFKEADETSKEVIDLDEDIPDGVVNYDVDLDSTLFDEDSDGVYLKFLNPATEETSYVHIYNDNAAYRGDGGVYGWGTVKVDVIGIGIVPHGDHPFHNGVWRAAVFKSAYGANEDEVINGIKIVTGGVHVSTQGWGWSYENPSLRFPYWDVKDGFYCVNISTSIPVDLQ